MRKKQSKSNIFLISFLPAVLYWYLETKYPVKIALIGGIALSIAEIVFEKIYTGHVHQLSKFNFFLILFLGGFSLMEEDGIWFKLQPTLSLWAVSFYMGIKLKKGSGFIKEMMMDINPDSPKPPDIILRQMEINLTILFFFYGIFMAILAKWFQTAYWVFFKTAGLFIVMGVFMFFQAFWNRRAIRKIQSSGHLL